MELIIHISLSESKNQWFIDISVLFVLTFLKYLYAYLYVCANTSRTPGAFDTLEL